MGKSNFEPLTEREIKDFFNEIDGQKRGWVSVAELRAKLESFYIDENVEPSRHPGFTSIFRGGAQDVEKQKRDHAVESHGAGHFAFQLLPRGDAKLDFVDFTKIVHAWGIPSQHQTSSEGQDAYADAYERRLPWSRRLQAHWAIEGPRILFVCFVVAVMLACGLWECVKFSKDKDKLAAFGPGVVIAKTMVGIMYPSMTFMLLSMSRWLATSMRRWGPLFVNRAINWDRHQSFHIWMAVTTMIAGIFHALSHLSGTFVHGSREVYQPAVAAIIGKSATPMSYSDWIRTRPGWTGIAMTLIFFVMGLLSIPQIRRMRYEVFQLGHILMFAFVGLLVAHGTRSLLQKPMMGYWLIVPFLLVISERLHRVYRGFVRIPATLEVVDSDTVRISWEHQSYMGWRYSAGQYALLQIPELSLFQWHPFTISGCKGKTLQFHIKTDGNWTSKLRSLPNKIAIGVDGPYGAPAQRFYEYDRALVIGAGIGVTPFSAILTDLERQLSENKQSAWRNPSLARGDSKSSTKSAKSMMKPSLARGDSNSSLSSAKSHFTPSLARGDSKSSTTSTKSSKSSPTPSDDNASMHSFDSTTTSSTLPLHSAKAVALLGLRPSKRVDFHWMVRERNQISWFSDLLNRVSSITAPSTHITPLSSSDEYTPVKLNINTYVTARRKAISEHVSRYLLDRYRSNEQPVSPLTGLETPSGFVRPDFKGIVRRFHGEMRAQGWCGGKVGVFFCGNANVGRVLSDLCVEFTRRGRADGSRIRYEFNTEVFG
ncbi:MAG: hypothetical protein M1831_001543 [Alyxoria varia]|nr:MAG: hypothetical protein M1831_001543 [Alyxoria varia]